MVKVQHLLCDNKFAFACLDLLKSVCHYTVLLLVLSVFPVAADHHFPIEKLTIYIPGNKGGAYDHTAQSIKQVLSPHYVSNVEFKHIIGAGGALALGQFVMRNETDELAILLGGKSMIGAVSYNNSDLSILDTRPLAKLICKPMAIAVPYDSPVEDIEQLFTLMKRDPNRVKWLGGSAGAIDFQFLHNMISHLQLPHSPVLYDSAPGGGIAIDNALKTSQYMAVLSSFDELRLAYLRKRVRVLAVTSSLTSDPSIPLLHINQQPLEFTDWHGVFVAKNTSSQVLQQLTELLRILNASFVWQALGQERGWKNQFSLGDAFFQFVVEEEKDTRALLEWLRNPSNKTTQHEPFDKVADFLLQPYRTLMFASVFCVLLIVFILVSKFNAQEREKQLSNNLKKAQQEQHDLRVQLSENLKSVAAHIDAEFERWQLTKAEKEVGLFLLKGFSFKEIAEMRCKSERTVRQQAGSIYAKSSLANRNDLSAYFLEDLL